MNPANKVKAHLSRLSESGDLEGLCHRCGDCCHLSVRVHTPRGMERVLISDLPCKFLVFDNGESACGVYPERFKKAPWCQNTEGGMTAGLYTPGCGYIKEAPWYRGSVPISDDLLQYMIPAVIKSVNHSREPFAEQDIERFFRKWT